jgi:threonine aldolase
MSAAAARGFASDNHAGAHPRILEAIAAANEGHVTAYGEDRFTAAAADTFRSHFGSDAEAYAVFNGTAANVLAIDAVTRPHEAVICAESAHMNVDECGAPERIAGVKLLTLPHRQGKIDPAHLGRWDSGRDDEHRSQPRLASISQATELGTVYTPAETRAFADAAHERGMLLHVDGARIANAAARLDLPLAALTTDAGVDVLSFGGTKNGLLLGDAVVFLRPGLDGDFRFLRKQGLQLASKMRFISAQFATLLGTDLWLENARHANAMASMLAGRAEALPDLEIVHPVEANAVFAALPRTAVRRLLERAAQSTPFHVWEPADGDRDVVRWMCAWDTRPEDVDAFAEAIAEALR